MNVFHLKSNATYDVPDDVYRKGGGPAATKWIDDLLAAEQATRDRRIKAKEEEVARIRAEQLKREEETKSEKVPELESLRRLVSEQRQTIVELESRLVSNQSRMLEDMDTILKLRARLEPTEAEKQKLAEEQEKKRERVERSRVLFEAMRAGQLTYEELLDDVAKTESRDSSDSPSGKDPVST